MKKFLTTLFTLLSSILIAIPVMAATTTVPEAYSTPNRVTFQVTATTEDSEYITFEWHCTDEEIDNNSESGDGWRHTYHSEVGDGEWSITDTLLIPDIEETKYFYCIIHDEHGDERSRTFRTDDAQACLAYNLDERVRAVIGVPYGFEIKTSPEIVPNNLVKDLQWFSKQAGSSVYTAIQKNANDWTYVTPDITENDNGSSYFLRSRVNGLDPSLPSVNVDTTPVTLSTASPTEDIPVITRPDGIPSNTPVVSLRASYVNPSGTQQYSAFSKEDFEVQVKYKNYPDWYFTEDYVYDPLNADTLGNIEVTIKVNDGVDVHMATCTAWSIQNANRDYTEGDSLNVPVTPVPDGIPENTPINYVSATYVNPTGTPQYTSFKKDDFQVSIQYYGYPGTYYTDTFAFRPTNATVIGDVPVTIYVNDGTSINKATCVAKCIANSNRYYDLGDKPVSLGRPVSDMRVAYTGTGNYQYYRWNKDDFKVEVMFTGESTWTEVSEFVVTPQNSDTIGRQDVTVTVYDGTDYISRSCTAICIKNPNRSDEYLPTPPSLDRAVDTVRATYVGTGNPQYTAWNLDDFVVEVEYSDNAGNFDRVDAFYVKPTNSDILGTSNVLVIVNDGTKLHTTNCSATCIANPNYNYSHDPQHPDVVPVPSGIDVGTTIESVTATYINPTGTKQFTALTKDDFKVDVKYTGSNETYTIGTYGFTPVNATVVGNFLVRIYVNDGTTIHQTTCIATGIENDARYNGPYPQPDPAALPYFVDSVRATYNGSGNLQYTAWNKNDFIVEVSHGGDWSPVTDFIVTPPNSDYLGVNNVTITVKGSNGLVTTTCAANCVKNPDFNYTDEIIDQPSVNPTPDKIPESTSISDITVEYTGSGVPQFTSYKQADFNVKIKYKGYPDWYNATVFSISPKYPTVLGNNTVTVYVNDGISVKKATCTVNCIENPERAYTDEDPTPLPNIVTSLRASYTGSGNVQYTAWNKADFKVEVKYSGNINWNTVTDFKVTPVNSDTLGTTKVIITVIDSEGTKQTVLCDALCIANEDVPYDYFDPKSPLVNPTPPGVPSGTQIKNIRASFVNESGVPIYTAFTPSDFKVEAQYTGYNEWYPVSVYGFIPKNATTLGDIEVTFFVNDGTSILSTSCVAKCVANENRGEEFEQPYPEALDGEVTAVRASYIGLGNPQFNDWNKDDFKVEVKYKDNPTEWQRVTSFNVTPYASDILGDVTVTISVYDGIELRKTTTTAKCVLNPNRYSPDEADRPNPLSGPITQVKAAYKGSGNLQYTMWNKDDFKVEVKFKSSPDVWTEVHDFTIIPHNSDYVGKPTVTVLVYDGYDLYSTSCVAKCIKNPNYDYTQTDVPVNPTPTGIPAGTSIEKVKAEYTGDAVPQFTAIDQSYLDVQVKYEGYKDWYKASVFAYSPKNATSIGNVTVTVYVNDGNEIKNATCKVKCVANPERIDPTKPQVPESLGRPVTDVHANYIGEGNYQYLQWNKSDFIVEVKYTNSDEWVAVDKFVLNPPNSDELGQNYVVVTVFDGDNTHTCYTNALCIENPNYDYSQNDVPKVPKVPDGIPLGTTINRIKATFINTTGVQQYNAYKPTDFKVQVEYASNTGTWYDVEDFSISPKNADKLGYVDVLITVNDGSQLLTCSCTTKVVSKLDRDTPGSTSIADLPPVVTTDVDGNPLPTTALKSVKATCNKESVYQYTSLKAEYFDVYLTFEDDDKQYKIDTFGFSPHNVVLLGKNNVIITVVTEQGTMSTTCTVIGSRNPKHDYSEVDGTPIATVDIEGTTLPVLPLEKVIVSYKGNPVEQYTAYNPKDFLVQLKYVGDARTYTIDTFELTPKNAQFVGDNVVVVDVYTQYEHQSGTCVVQGIQNSERDYSGDDEPIVCTTDVDGNPLPGGRIETLTAEYIGNPVKQYTKISKLDIKVTVKYEDSDTVYTVDGFTYKPKNADLLGDNVVIVTFNGEVTSCIVEGIANDRYDYSDGVDTMSPVTEDVDGNILPNERVVAISASYEGEPVSQYSAYPKDSFNVVLTFENGESYRINKFAILPSNADYIGDNTVVIVAKTNLNIMRTSCVVPCVASTDRDTSGTNTIITTVDTKGKKVPDAPITSMSAVYNGPALEQYKYIPHNKFRVVATFEGSDEVHEFTDFNVFPANADKLGDMSVLVTIKTNYGYTSYAYAIVPVIQNSSRNYDSNKTTVDIDGNPLPDADIYELRAVYIGEGTEQFTAYDKNDFNVYARFVGSENVTYKIGDFNINPKNCENVGYNIVMITVNDYTTKCLAKGIQYSEHTYTNSIEVMFSQNNSYTLYDGSLIPSNAITVTLAYASGSITTLIPNSNEVTFVPNTARVGNNDYTVLYRYGESTYYEGTVNLKAYINKSSSDNGETSDDTETTVDDLPDELMKDIDVTYIGSGARVNDALNPNDFEVFVTFDHIDEPIRVKNFVLDPKVPQLIGDQEVIVTVNHGMDTIEKAITIPVVFNPDLNHNNVDDSTVVNIKTSYTDTHITEGTDYVPDSLTITATTDGGSSYTVPVDDCSIEVEDTPLTYKVHVVYEDCSDVLTLIKDTATIESIEATYQGQAVAGSNFDPDHMYVMLVFNNGTKERTQSYDVDPYTLAVGDNIVRVSVGSMSTDVHVPAISQESVTVNAPEINIKVITNRTQISSSIQDSLKSLGMNVSYTSEDSGYVEITVIDKKTSNDSASRLMYALDLEDFQAYEGVVVSEVHDVLMVRAKAVYGSKESEVVKKFVYLDKSKNVVEAVPKGIRATWNGGTVPQNGTLEADYITCVYYFDGTSYTVPITDFVVEPYSIQGGDNAITVTYDNFKTTVNVPGEKDPVTSDTSVKKEVASISVQSNVDNLAVGTEVTKSMLEVTAKYNDATTTTVTDYTLSASPIKMGANYIVVSYKGCNDDCVIYGVGGEVAEGNDVADKSYKVTVDEEPETPAISFASAVVQPVQESAITLFTNVTEPIPEVYEPVAEKPEFVYTLNDDIIKSIPVIEDISNFTKISPTVLFSIFLFLLILILLAIIALILYKRGKLEGVIEKVASKSDFRFNAVTLNGDLIKYMLVNIHNTDSVTVTYELVGNEITDNKTIVETYDINPNEHSMFITYLVDPSKLYGFSLSATDANGRSVQSDFVEL